MPWFKVDDTLHGHPKHRKAGLAAIGLWTVAGSYCSQYTTEGFVPDWYVAGWPSGRKLAGRLVDTALWDESERDGESGWQFHDWEHYQMTKEEIERDREANRERQRKFREKRREARDAAIRNGA
jgi:hypothetical protein